MDSARFSHHLILCAFKAAIMWLGALFSEWLCLASRSSVQQNIQSETQPPTESYITQKHRCSRRFAEFWISKKKEKKKKDWVQPSSRFSTLIESKVTKYALCGVCDILVCVFAVLTLGNSRMACRRRCLWAELRIPISSRSWSSTTLLPWKAPNNRHG